MKKFIITIVISLTMFIVSSHIIQSKLGTLVNTIQNVAAQSKQDSSSQGQRSSLVQATKTSSKKTVIPSSATLTEASTSSSAKSTSVNNDPNLQFAVISDTHIDANKQYINDKLTNALKDLKNVAPNYEAIAVDGDLTNHGLIGEYDIFNKIMNANKNSNAEEFMVMGNHEWREQSALPSTTVTDAQLNNRFIEEENVPNIYYDKWIKGYHFITIAGEESATTLKKTYGSSDADYAYISNTQYQWLEKTLAMNAESDKPIFVFLHQPITNTVYGSEWGAGFQDQKLLALLKKYPQVILFSGHSHYPLNNSKSIITNGITMVNTSSVAYTYNPDTKQSNYQQSQGYVVNVYDNKVELKAREFSNHTWIGTVTIPLSK